jgi:predicted RNA polymerase sigma factor
MFLCAHPALNPDAQVALMLRFCGGVPVSEIARWFYQPFDTVQKRLHRAKDKLASSGAAFDLPPLSAWPDRLPSVLSALEIIYDQSYSNVGGGVEVDGCAREAEQLALQLCDQLLDAEALGLAALILLAESRRAARLDQRGAMIPLDQQDTTLWDASKIRLAARLLRRASSLQNVGRYQIRAMISAQHARRAELGKIPWSEIMSLYQALIAVEQMQGEVSEQSRYGLLLAEAECKEPELTLVQFMQMPASASLAHAVTGYRLATLAEDSALAQQFLQRALQSSALGSAERKRLLALWQEKTGVTFMAPVSKDCL